MGRRTPRTRRSDEEMQGALKKHAILLQRYCALAFGEGREEYLGEIAAKLRLLAIETRKNTPLLQSVMKAKEIDPQIGGLTLEAFLSFPAVGVKVGPSEYKDLSYGDFIRGWAEQMGGAHEDWAVDDALAMSFRLPAYVKEADGLHMNVLQLRHAARFVLGITLLCLRELGVEGIVVVRQGMSGPLDPWHFPPELLGGDDKKGT